MGFTHTRARVPAYSAERPEYSPEEHKRVYVKEPPAPPPENPLVVAFLSDLSAFCRERGFALEASEWLGVARVSDGGYRLYPNGLVEWERDEP